MTGLHSNWDPITHRLTVSLKPLTADEVKLLGGFSATVDAKLKVKVTVKVEPCQCGRQEYRHLKHVRLLMTIRKSSEGNAEPFIVFSRSTARRILSSLVERGYIALAQAEVAQVAVDKHIQAEDFSYPPNEELEYRFMRQHFIDDGVVVALATLIKE